MVVRVRQLPAAIDARREVRGHQGETGPLIAVTHGEARLSGGLQFRNKSLLNWCSARGHAAENDGPSDK